VRKLGANVFLWYSSSGLLLYAALVDLLAEDFLSEEANRTLTKKDRITAFAFVILGGKAGVGLWCSTSRKLTCCCSDWHVDCRCLCVSLQTDGRRRVR